MVSIYGNKVLGLIFLLVNSIVCHRVRDGPEDSCDLMILHL